MNEALCSILCGEDEWCFDPEGRTIKFNKDGTGELVCRCNLNYWITAEIEWKMVSPLRPIKPTEPQDQTADIKDASTQKNSSNILGQLNLEITLTKRLPSWAQISHLAKVTTKSSEVVNVNERTLTDDAFQPKLYTVRIEKGNFQAPCYLESTDWRYAYRLIFDKSPYPSRSQWTEPERGPDDSQFWDHIEFVGRSTPGLEKQGRAMNGPALEGWGSCIVS